MDIASRNGPNRVLTAITFLAISLFLFIYLSHSWSLTFLNEDFDPNQSGDWLINYSGGFIRRGLMGEILDRSVPQSVSIIVALGYLQILILGFLFASFTILFFRSTKSPAWIMVCLSPAVLMFPAVNPEAAFRKELLPLLALALLALGAKLGIRLWLLFASLAIYTLAVFSHEASIAVLPGLVYLVREFTSSPYARISRIANAYLIGISLVAGILALRFPGSQEQIDAICTSWSDRGIGNCYQGSLAAMTTSVLDSVDFLFTNYYPEYFLYLLVISLAIFPLFLVRFLPQHWKLAVVAVLVLLPLFVGAWDYGRWIFIGFAELSLVALALESRKKLAPAINVPLIVALGYAFLWGFSWYEQVFREPLIQQLLQQLALIT